MGRRPPGVRRALVAAARADKAGPEFLPLADFLTDEFPQADPLLGDDDQILLAVGTLLLVFGADGAAKSTWRIDGIVHLAAGRAWLGATVLRPVRVCIVENEGLPSLFQRKLADKAATWDGDPFTHNLFVYMGPWGYFSFAEPDHRLGLADFCDEHEIDLVCANPTLGLGVAGTG